MQLERAKFENRLLGPTNFLGIQIHSVTGEPIAYF